MKQLQRNLRQLTGFLLLMMAWLAPMSLWAEETVVEVGGLYYKLNTAAKTATLTKPTTGSYTMTNVVVPGAFNVGATAYTVTEIEKLTFYNCSQLTSLTLPDGLTKIGERAIAFTGITSLHIPASVSFLYAQAIYANRSLTSITVDTDNKTYYAKDNCLMRLSDRFLVCAAANITAVPMGVRGIDPYGLAYLTSSSLTLPDGLEFIAQFAFEHVANLQAITIPGTVRSIGDHPFILCDKLNSLVVSPYNTVYDSRNNCNAIIETATNTLIGSCPKTTIPNTVVALGKYAFKESMWVDDNFQLPSSVKLIDEWAFDNCGSLKNYTVAEGVERICAGAFEYCYSLESITLPSTLKNISAIVFEWDDNLKDVTCLAVTPPAYDGGKETMFGNVPMDDVTLHVPAGTKKDYQNAAGWKDFGTILEDGESGGGESGGGGTGDLSVYKSTFISVTKTGTDGGWQGVLGAEETEDPNDPEKTRNWSLFIKDRPTATVMKGSVDDKPVVYIISGSSVDAHQADFLSAFPLTGKVKNVVVNCGNNIDDFTVKPQGDDTHVITFVPENHGGEAAMHDIEIPCEGLELNNQYLEFKVVINYINTPFAIRSITINMETDGPGGEKPYEVDGIYYAMNSFDHEATVVPHPTDKYKGQIKIPATITRNEVVYTVTAIGDEAFKDCSELTMFTFGANLKSIGVEAFAYSNLKGEVLLPSKLETIGDRAFYYCKGVKKLLINASLESIGSCAFGGMANIDMFAVDKANLYFVSPNSCGAIIGKNNKTGEFDMLVAGGNKTTTIPPGVKYILEEAFSERQNLNISLPADLTRIDSKAFYNAHINDMYYLNTDIFAQTEMDIFDGTSGMFKVLHVLPENLSTFKSHAPWTKFKSIVAVETAEPYSADEPIVASDLEGKDLEDNVIDGVYYNLNSETGNGVVTDEYGTCLVISEPTDMDAISDPTPGLPEMAEKFNGIVILLEAGSGVLNIDVKTVPPSQLAVKFGDGEEKVFSVLTKKTQSIAYNLDKPTYVYIYAVNGSAGARLFRAADDESGESGVMIYGISVSDGSVEVLMGDADNSGKVDVTDVTAVISKILGKNPQPFNEPAADVTGEGTIDVSDVTAIINIILGKK